MVAVVTDGSAVLGLGNIGPAAAQPVMERKCAIFKTFGEVDAFPLCLATQNADEIVATVERVAPVFGGSTWKTLPRPSASTLRSGSAAPRDPGHIRRSAWNGGGRPGNAHERLEARRQGAGAGEDRGQRGGGRGCRNGADARAPAYGASSTAIARARSMPAASHPSRPSRRHETNRDREHGVAREVLRGADVFIGVSGPGVIDRDAVASMAHDPVVFALVNPVPEVQPEALEGWRGRSRPAERLSQPDQ